MIRFIPFLAFFLAFGLSLDAQDTELQHIKPSISSGYYLGEIPSLGNLPEEDVERAMNGQNTQVWEKKNHFLKNDWVNEAAQPMQGDPALQGDKKEETENLIEGITVLVDVPGLSNTGANPPDPTGDIGKNHYMMATNSGGGSRIKIFDKAGNTAVNNLSSSTFWSQVGRSSVGDPIVAYDHSVERWVFVEMEGGNGLLFAISNTSDPTLGWKAYYFATEGFPDYPKFAVWGNSYFITVNEIVDNNRCAGYALDKAAILGGANTFATYRFDLQKFGGIQYQPAIGADWEGGAAPPANSPGYIFRVYDDAWGNSGTDHLEVWEIHANWQNPTQSVVIGPKILYTQPFETRVCVGSGLFNCVEQPDANAPRLTALENIIMYRAPYRNFGGYESVVLNHVSDVENNQGDGGRAGIRWYELRKSPGGDWEIYQESTYAPGNSDERFMSMITQDDRGNIATVYTIAGVNTYPGLGIVGRRGSDPINIMSTDELIFAPGGASHFGTRWGDYVNVSVDPEDGRTFWLVGEYQPAGNNWSTRVGSFTVSKDSFDTSPTLLVAPQNNHLLGTSETVTVRINNLGLTEATNLSATLRFEGQDVVSNPVTGSIAQDGSVDFTFSETVDMDQVGKTYVIEVITHNAVDQFEKNDTLRARVRKLTSFDAAVGGTLDFPGLVCASEHNYNFLLKNQGQEPMTSAQISQRLNGVWTTQNWTGNLAPGAVDTIPMTASPIKNGSNFITHVTNMPNGLADQDTANDTVLVKFTGKITGSWANLQIHTVFGQLRWEIRNANGQLQFFGTATADTDVDVCLDNEACYELFLSGKPFGWQGSFEFLDIFGNSLVEAKEIFGEEIFQICTPERLQEDAGAYRLLNPMSSGSLSSMEQIQLAVRNYGFVPQTNLEVHYRLDNGTWRTETLTGTLQPGETQTHTFTSTEDLSTLGQAYAFEAFTRAANDEQAANDTIKPIVFHQALFEIELVNAKAFQVCYDTALASFELELKNNGLTMIESIRLAYTINGITQEEDILVTIVPGETVFLPFYSGGHSFGTNNLMFTILGVNNQGADFDQTNNAATVDYTINQNGFPLEISLVLDANPTETSWVLKDAAGSIVAESTPYNQAEAMIDAYYCLDSACYTLTLIDAAGNGFDGRIDINSSRSGLARTYENLNFTDEITLDICLTDLCASFSQTVEVQGISAIGQTNGSITVAPQGGAAPYVYFLNNQLVQGPVITGLAIGSYQLRTVDANGCALTQQVTVSVMVAADEVANERKLSMSPNPTKSLVHVQLPALDQEEIAYGEVFHANGQRLFRFPLTRWDAQLSGMFSLEKEKPAVYWVRVRTGDAVFLGKVVKE